MKHSKEAWSLLETLFLSAASNRSSPWTLYASHLTSSCAHVCTVAIRPAHSTIATLSYFPALHSTRPTTSYQSCPMLLHTQFKRNTATPRRCLTAGAARTSNWHRSSMQQLLKLARGFSTARLHTQAASGSSSSSSSAATDLKSALRRLYMCVHPDMCGDNLDARAENEKSFKLLQEYLGRAKSTTGDARDSLFPQFIHAYRLVFYLRDQPDDRSKTENGGGSGFRKVEVSLSPPPPAPPSPPKVSDGSEGTYPDLRLHPEARSGLMRLLKACGIETALNNQWFEEEEVSMSKQSLSIFLPGAVEALRRAESGSVSDGVRAATIRGAMRLQRKVLVSFPNGSQIAPSTQVAALQALARVLDSSPVRHLDLSGCNLLLGSGPGIDRLGNLLLDLGPAGLATHGQPELTASHFSELALEWRDLLLGVDLDFVKSRKALLQAVRELESGVAASLGVAAIFATNPLHLVAEPSYREFLERLAAAVTEKGPIGQGTQPLSNAHGQQQQQQQQKKGPPFQDLALSVWSEYAFNLAHNQQQHQGQRQQGGQGSLTCVVDEDLGALKLHDGLSAEQVYSAVSRQGEPARAAMAKIKHRDAEVMQLVDRTRRTLRLRRLMRDERLAVHHFQVACHKLLEQADALSHVLDGASVRISFSNRVAPDSSYIDIAYNFMV